MMAVADGPRRIRIGTVASAVLSRMKNRSGGGVFQSTTRVRSLTRSTLIEGGVKGGAAGEQSERTLDAAEHGGRIPRRWCRTTSSWMTPLNRERPRGCNAPKVGSLPVQPRFPDRANHRGRPAESATSTLSCRAGGAIRGDIPVTSPREGTPSSTWPFCVSRCQR